MPDRQLLRDQLQQSERRYRELFDLAPQGIFVADREGTYIDVNNAGCALLGMSRKDIIGKTIVDLITAEDVPRLWEERKALEQPGTIVTSDWRIRRSDGTLINVEVSAAILNDGRWLGFVRDISQRKRIEAELQRSLEQETIDRRWLTAIVEQMPEGVIVMDQEGKVALMNQAANEFARSAPDGTPETDAFGNPVIFDLRSPSGEPIPFQEIPLVRALKTGKPVLNVELQLHQRDGAVPILANATPVLSANGAILGAVVVFNDIGGLKDLERARQEWVTIVAHDLRQPVQQILLATELLKQDETHLSSTSRRNLAEIEASVRGLDRLTEDLFDAARLESRQFTISREEVDLITLVEQIAKHHEVSSGRTIRISADSRRPCVASVDPQRIEQVMSNLLSNAVKYSTKDSDIEIEITSQDTQFMCSVTNYGTGLTPQELRRLFTRFYRVPGSERIAKGSGLGLYIAKGLVEAHGGTIWARSTPGKKTTFTFSLPCGA